MNIFLIGTCRIHRPFGCDYPTKKPLNYDCYNILNIWGSYNFLGTKYNIQEIRQFLNILTDKKSPLLNLNTNIIKKIFTNCYLDDNNFNKQIEDTYNKFKMADIVVIEISSIKNLTTIVSDMEITINLFKPDLENLENHKYETINEVKFVEHLKYIMEIMNKYNKKVLFVTHFNYNNNKNREFISNILKNNLSSNMVFDPSKLVIDNLPNSIVDEHHYSKDFDFLIMNEIHNSLKNL